MEESKRYPESLQSFFQRDTPQLFLIQLPDTLPGQGNESVDVKKSDKAGAEDTEPDQVRTVYILRVNHVRCLTGYLPGAEQLLPDERPSGGPDWQIHPLQVGQDEAGAGEHPLRCGPRFRAWLPARDCVRPHKCRRAKWGYDQPGKDQRKSKRVARLGGDVPVPQLIRRRRLSL